jgi:hypothetical protein
MPPNLPRRTYRPPFDTYSDRYNFRQPRYVDRLGDNGYIPPNLPSRNYDPQYDNYNDRYANRQPSYDDRSFDTRSRDYTYVPSNPPTTNYGNEYNNNEQYLNRQPSYAEENYGTRYREETYVPRNSLSSDNGGAPWYAPGNSFTNYFDLDRDENRRGTTRPSREYDSKWSNENSRNNYNDYNNGFVSPQNSGTNDENGWYSSTRSQNRGMNDENFDNRNSRPSDDVGWDSVDTYRRGDSNRMNGFRNANVRESTTTFEADQEPWYSTSNFKKNAFDVSVSTPAEKSDNNSWNSQQSSSSSTSTSSSSPNDSRDDDRMIDTFERLKNYNDNGSPAARAMHPSSSNVRERNNYNFGQQMDSKPDFDHDDLSYEDRMLLLQELDAKISKAIYMSKNIDDLISANGENEYEKSNIDERQKSTNVFSKAPFTSSPSSSSSSSRVYDAPIELDTKPDTSFPNTNNNSNSSVTSSSSEEPDQPR